MQSQEGLDHLDLELQMVLNCHQGAGNQTRTSGRAAMCHLSSLLPSVLKQTLPLNQELAVLARHMASKPEGAFYLCSPTPAVHGVQYRLHSSSSMGAGALDSGLHACIAYNYTLSRLPRHFVTITVEMK